MAAAGPQRYTIPTAAVNPAGSAAAFAAMPG